MLGSAVAGVIRVANVGTPRYIGAINKVVRNSSIGKMKVELIQPIRIIENNIIRAGCVPIRAAIPIGNYVPAREATIGK